MARARVKALIVAFLFFHKIIFSLIFDKTFIVICLMFGSKSYWPNERSTVQSYSSIAHIHTFIFMPRKANVIISPLKQSVDLENGAKNSSIKYSKDIRD